jgi:lipoic acid synthetase
MAVKSGLMVGLGETDGEVCEVMADLRDSGCDILTIGQYLKPARGKLEVSMFVHPDKFSEYEKTALEMGFRYVASGPFVRSSYRAEEAWNCVDGTYGVKLR